MGETTMILFLTATLAGAAPDALVTHLESRSYKVQGNILVVSQDKALLEPLNTSDLLHEVLPKMGDLDKEIARLQNKHGTPCVLQLRKPVTPAVTSTDKDSGNSNVSTISEDSDVESTKEEGNTELPIGHTQPHVYTIEGVENLEIVEQGRCTVDDTMRYSIKDNGPHWTVVDNQENEVSVHAFANVCEDLPLLLRLDLEDQISHRNGKVLEWGATALAIGGLFTLGNPDPGFSAREQNTFWTGVFLFGTASMLYTQRDAPFVYKTDRQSDLSNYHSREEVERILLKTFGEEVVEEIGEVSKDLQEPEGDDNSDDNDVEGVEQDGTTQSTDASTETTEDLAPSNPNSNNSTPKEETETTKTTEATKGPATELSDTEDAGDKEETEDTKPTNSEVTP